MNNDTALDIQLSGTIDARSGGHPVALPGRRARTLLALLALTPRRTVSAGQLSLGLWGDEPPKNATASLHTCVSRLRSVVGEHTLVRTQGGYALMVPDHQVDLVHFARLVTFAHTDERGEYAALCEALRLWNGPPFGQIQSDWLDHYETPRLTELYLTAVERRIRFDLAEGRAGSCLSELDSYIRQFPLRETLWVLMLQALHAAGRRAEALARYEQLRERLADELGTDPSLDVQAVFHQLLTAEQEFEPNAPRQPRPRSLPRIAGRFVGRKDALSALDEAEETAADNEEGIATVIYGPGGAGKTALAVHWANRRREAFPDGLLFVDLRGFGHTEPLREPEITDLLLSRLGISGIPADMEPRGRLEWLHDELADQHALLILDNARDVDQVRSFLPNGRCGVLITSRHQLRQLIGYEGLQRMPLADMDESDAVAMLRCRLGLGTSIPTGGDLEELASLCGRLPVALAVVAERAGRCQPLAVRTIIDELRDRRRRMRALDAGADEQALSVRTVFDYSYEILDDRTQRLLALIGLLDSDCVCIPSAATLAGIEHADARRALDNLAAASLLRDTGTNVFALHDLVQSYCRDLAQTQLSEVERTAALHRLHTWYAHTGAAAACAVGAPPRIIDLPPLASGITPLQFDSAIDATRWSILHRWTLERHARAALSSGECRWAAWIMLGLRAHFVKVNGDARLRRELFADLADLATENGDSVVENVARNGLGLALLDQRECRGALDAFLRCAELSFSDDEPRIDVRLRAQINLAVAYRNCSEADQSISILHQVRETAHRAGCDGPGRLAQLHLAQAHGAQGDVEHEIDLAQAAADDFAAAGEWHRWGGAVLTCARALVRCGRKVEAQKYYRTLLVRADELGDIGREVQALHELGLLQCGTGELASARDSWERALRRMAEEGEGQMVTLTRADLQRLIDTFTPDDATQVPQ